MQREILSAFQGVSSLMNLRCASCVINSLNCSSLTVCVVPPTSHYICCENANNRCLAVVVVLIKGCSYIKLCDLHNFIFVKLSSPISFQEKLMNQKIKRFGFGVNTLNLMTIYCYALIRLINCNLKKDNSVKLVF